jgi:hypothetical protein
MQKQKLKNQALYEIENFEDLQDNNTQEQENNFSSTD